MLKYSLYDGGGPGGWPGPKTHNAGSHVDMYNVKYTTYNTIHTH